MLNLKKDFGGRRMAIAMSQAYQMGLDDARALKKLGREIYPRKTGKVIASEIASEFTEDQSKFLQASYAAAMWQAANHDG
jgi:hypothetical protein